MLGWLATAIVGGIGLGYYWPEGAPLLLRLVLGASLVLGCAAALARSQRGLAVPAALALAGIAAVGGMARGVQAAPGAAELPGALPASATVSFEAVLLSDPAPYGDAIRLRARPVTGFGSSDIEPGIELDVVTNGLVGAAESGRPPDGFMEGDRVLVAGRLSAVPASRHSAFVVNATSVRLAALDTDAAWLARLRGRLGASIDRASPEPVAGLVKAMVTGSRTGLDQETRSAFRRSGTSHVLAISGLHVGIFASMAIAATASLFGKGSWLYVLVPAGVVWAYALIAGLSAPVARAAVMATVFLVGRGLGRQNSVAPALGLAAAALAVLDPALPGDVSFQLSFLAVLGIAVVAPAVQGLGESMFQKLETWPACVLRVLAWVNSGVAMSVGAICLTAPVIVLRFDALSAWGTPATLFQVPALPVLIVAGIFEGLLGILAPSTAFLAAWPAWLAASYVIAVARFFGSLPGGAIAPSAVSMAVAAAFYALILGVLLGRRSGTGRSLVFAWAAFRRTGLDRAGFRVQPARPVPGLALVAMAAAVALTWTAIASERPAGLRVTFFETTGGDAILITTPGGRQVMVDGGDSTSGAVRSLSTRLPFWDRTLDLVVLTHPHSDHARGLLAILDRYRVAAILDSPSHYDSDVYAEWLVRAGEEGAARVEAVPGTVVDLGDGTTIEVLLAAEEAAAPDPNDRSVVLLLRYGETAYLLTGDLSAAGEAELIRSGRDLRAMVLKVGHQGSKTSSSPEFLASVRPSLAVVPASIGNRYGHPHPEAMERIGAVVDPDRILITAVRGTVDVESDGRRLTVRTER